MAPKRATRSNIAPETTNTTSVTNAQLQEMINQGITSALAARDVNTNGVDNHNSGTGARRNERATHKSTENANNANNQRGTGSGQKPTCLKCEVQGSLKRNVQSEEQQQPGTKLEWQCFHQGIAVGHAGTNPPELQRRDGYVPSKQPLCFYLIRYWCR
ncbi:hypothetical protein Tco_0126446 [Tanacetum coccineum]